MRIIFKKVNLKNKLEICNMNLVDGCHLSTVLERHEPVGVNLARGTVPAHYTGLPEGPGGPGGPG